MMKKKIENAIAEIRQSRSLSGPTLVTLNKLCGNRFWKALQAVANDLVKRYIFDPSGREAWIVVGKKRDYHILSDIYCDCEDFYINVIVKRRAELCYHILARILAEALNTFTEIRVDDMMYETFQGEWEATPKSRSNQRRRQETR